MGYRVEGNKVIYDIYETRGSLSQALQGCAIDWKNTTHDPESGEFTATFAKRAGSVSVPEKAPPGRGEPCPYCGHPLGLPDASAAPTDHAPPPQSEALHGG